MSTMAQPHFDRRHFMRLLGVGLASCASVGFAPRAAAQGRLEMLRILCGYPPGGSVDIVGRKLADKLAGGYANAAIVENKSGAAGRIAVQELKRSLADGSTMLVTPASVITMYPHVFRDLGYDVFTDLTPVSIVAGTAFAFVVGPKVPASVGDVRAFVQWARAEPAAAQCGNAGAGSMPHFLGLLLARETAIDLAHVPYRGGSAAMLAAAGGEIASAIATESAARPLVAGGRLRVLATTGVERSPFFPGSPTFRQLGWPALTREEWFGMFMPPRSPSSAAATAARAIESALREPEIRDAWEKASLIVQSSTPQKLREAIRSEYDEWGRLTKAFGFTPES